MWPLAKPGTDDIIGTNDIIIDDIILCANSESSHQTLILQHIALRLCTLGAVAVLFPPLFEEEAPTRLTLEKYKKAPA